MANWLSYLWYEVNLRMCMAGTTFALSQRSEGSRHIPRHGPALLLANHQSYLDPVIIGSAAERHLCYLARHTLYRNPIFGWLIRSLQAAPINQDGFAREGLKTVLTQLQAGRAVLIFPEGNRTSDGRLQPLMPGAQLLIRKLDMPVIVVGIAGAYEAWPRSRKYPLPAPIFLPARKGSVAVSITRPIASRDLRDLPREQLLAKLTALMQTAIARAERIRRKP